MAERVTNQNTYNSFQRRPLNWSLYGNKSADQLRAAGEEMATGENAANTDYKISKLHQRLARGMVDPAILETPESSEARMARLYGDQTPDQLRAASEEMGDTEFQAALAPYNNYTGGMPSEVARYQGMYAGAGKGPVAGYYVPEGEGSGERAFPYRNPNTGQIETMPYERGTVNAVTVDAEPSTWAHEYSHRTHAGIPKWQGDAGEKRNRIADAFRAPDKRSFEKAVHYYHNWETTRGRRPNLTPTAARRELLDKLALDNSIDFFGSYKRAVPYELYKEELAAGAFTPEAFRTEPFLPWTDYDESMLHGEPRPFIDYTNMREAQSYWSQALREMRAEDASLKADGGGGRSKRRETNSAAKR